mmetsp:Transcript_29877/g.45271  ORF Transcript_29877/g.45271 Transcript_29877/m.45271 type:complete len:168 (-) Transcript_29877:115-618(-)
MKYTPDFFHAILLSISCLCLIAPATNAFLLQNPNMMVALTDTELKMGLFDGIAKAFSNEEYGPPPEQVRATARHILVKSSTEADSLKGKLLDDSASFSDLAREFSTCPSGKQGGSLGSFSPGTMVAEFDAAIFNPDTKIGQIVGPLQTQFGYHLIVVDKRTGGGDWY